MYFIQVGENEVYERDSYKEMKKLVNRELKKKKNVKVNDQEIKEPITKANWGEK